jgi:acylphosphatase
MKRLRILVHGKVQNVGFRSYVKNLADKLSLNGWVRNNPDGSVEILVEGTERLLEEFLDYCKKGPPLSRIDKVDVFEEKISEKFKRFEILF